MLLRPGVLTVLLVCACSVDQRQLRPVLADEGVAGAAEEAGTGGNGAGSASSGQDGGAPASDLVDGCADLDTDGVADCETTLVKTATFSDDVSDWLPETDATLIWAPQNALSDVPSGSARLSAAVSRTGALQCVALRGHQLVIAYANAFVEQPVSEGSVQAQLEVSYFETTDCTGARSGYFETPQSGVTDAWTTIQAGGVANEATRSVSIALIGSKAAEVPSLRVYFDNVMLKAEEL